MRPPAIRILLLSSSALLFSSPSMAGRPQRRAASAKDAGQAIDASRFFATRRGLLRVYAGRGRRGPDGAPPAGASCEVLSVSGPDEGKPVELKETCAMIVGRKAQDATALTYQLRKDGIWNTQVQPQGTAEPQPASRMVLPSPLTVGSSWREPRGGVELDRSVRKVGGPCQAAGRGFADCLVLQVAQKEGKRVVRRSTETYAAGVGLVEDAQWELVDVKGL